MTNDQPLGINQSYDTNIEYLSKIQSDDDLYTLSKANEEFNNLKFINKHNSLDINVDNELSLTTSIQKQTLEYKKHNEMNFCFYFSCYGFNKFVHVCFVFIFIFIFIFVFITTG